VRASVAGLLAALSLVACRRSKLPAATHVWLSPTGGCVATFDTRACWGGEGGSTWAVPAPPSSAPAPEKLAALRDHTCKLEDDHTVHCWGKNDDGQLGDGTRTGSTSPVAVTGLRDVIAIGAGDRHTCAHLANRTVACWGANDHHQLANGTTEASARPGVIVGLVGVRQLAVAGDGACAIVDEGVVRCWGRNDRSQLGDGTTEEHNVPMPIRYSPAR
jgi:hypothetical protein